MDIFHLFDLTIEKQASDLHLIPDYYPTIRINNDLFYVRSANVLTQEIIEKLVISILNEE